MIEPKESYMLCLYVSAGPQQAMAGTYDAGPQYSREACVLAVSGDLSKIKLGAEWQSGFGDDARIVGAIAYQRKPNGKWAEISRSPWFDKLDWSKAPQNGQPV